MTFGRDQLISMSEADLRQNVLLPLFRKMEFNDVFHHHGAQEQGKDIVMWKCGDVGERLNYAVVAKAGTISGSATGRGSAGEVFTQVMQCFGDPFVDGTTLEHRDVQRCLVVTSGRIAPQALTSLRSALQRSNHAAVTTFIDGEKLWELVERYLPAASVHEHLQQLVRKLNIENEAVQLIPELGLRVVSRHPSTSAEAMLNFSGKLCFPDTEDGRAAHAAFVEHTKTGAPVVVEPPFVTEFTFPKILEPLFGDGSDAKFSLVFGPREGREPIILDFKLVLESGKFAELRHLEFRVVQAGTEQVTLDNAHQPVPWHFRVSVNFVQGRLQIDSKAALQTANVNRALEFMRYMDAFAQGGTLYLIDANSGLPLASAHIPPDSVPRMDDTWEQILSALSFIQQRTNVYLTAPTDDVTHDEASELLAVSEIVRSGRLVYTNGGVFSFNVDRQTASNVLAAFGSESGSPMTFRSPGQVKHVFGTAIEMGPAVVVASAVRVEQPDKAVIEASLANPELSNIPIRVCALDGTQVQAIYEKWLPDSEREVRSLLTAFASDFPVA